MSLGFNYTISARRFASRFPALSYVGIQITFWIIANNLLALLLYLYTRFMSDLFDFDFPFDVFRVFVFLSFLGLLYGAVLGTADYRLDKRAFRGMSLAKVILMKTIITLIMNVLILSMLTAASFANITTYVTPAKGLFVRYHSWPYIVALFTIFYLLMTLLISFINQVNNKYGPGILLPLLFGKYKNPVEEQRVFLFMDLKSSTTIAENLGHLRYSAFIRDSFYDINQLLSSFNVEVYQYVGDEMVLTWRVAPGIPYHNCVAFFFACQDQFLKRQAYYQSHYGVFPVFKAGLHMGMVTAVEIGDIKRDIAYHGDAINTAARIQSVCNTFQKELLVSHHLLEHIVVDSRFKVTPLGEISLKGKQEAIEIAGIERMLDLK